MKLFNWIGRRILTVIFNIVEVVTDVSEWILDKIHGDKETKKLLNIAVDMYKQFGNVIKQYDHDIHVANYVESSEIDPNISAFGYSHSICLHYMRYTGSNTSALQLEDSLSINIEFDSKCNVKQVKLSNISFIAVNFESVDEALEFIKAGKLSELRSITQQYKKDTKILENKYKTELALLKL